MLSACQVDASVVFAYTHQMQYIMAKITHLPLSVEFQKQCGITHWYQLFPTEIGQLLKKEIEARNHGALEVLEEARSYLKYQNKNKIYTETNGYTKDNITIDVDCDNLDAFNISDGSWDDSDDLLYYTLQKESINDAYEIYCGAGFTFIDFCKINKGFEILNKDSISMRIGSCVCFDYKQIAYSIFVDIWNIDTIFKYLFSSGSFVSSFYQIVRAKQTFNWIAEKVKECIGDINSTIGCSKERWHTLMTSETALDENHSHWAKQITSIVSEIEFVLFQSGCSLFDKEEKIISDFPLPEEYTVVPDLTFWYSLFEHLQSSVFNSEQECDLFIIKWEGDKAPPLYYGGKQTFRHWNYGLWARSQYEEIIAQEIEKRHADIQWYLMNPGGRFTVKGERRSVEPDFVVFCDGKVGILEIDGFFHENEKSQKQDKLRDLAFSCNEIIVKRCTPNDVLQNPEQIINDLIASLQGNRPQ